MPDPTYDLAFETVGNATLIAHDRTPVLATDPWLSGSAYFGSWMLSHAIPEEQLASVRACPYIWVSHGHPDHLSMPSMATLKEATILLPDHVGGRIRDFLVEDGYQVRVLPDREWVPLSPRIRVCSIADVYQDAVLLVDLDGTLVINANDCNDHGYSPFVRREVRKHGRQAFLLQLCGYGDADMINYFDPDGNRIPPRAELQIPPGIAIANKMRLLDATRFIPFAAMHRYQREDSVWANEYCTPLEDLPNGFDESVGELLPPFIRYDVRSGVVTQLNPDPNPIVPHPAAEFGDDWSERLQGDDLEQIRAYFAHMGLLRDIVDTVTFRVGGEDHDVPVGQGTGRTVRFEVPRNSLMDSVKWEIFDDLLIGNFMKTTLFGDWPTKSLRPDFTARVAKYADNGRAFSQADMDAYVAEYRRRAGRDYWEYELNRRFSVKLRSFAKLVRARIPQDSKVGEIGKSIYAKAKR